MEILEVKNLRKSYGKGENKVNAVDDISLKLENISYYEEAQRTENAMVLVISIFLYGFITVITLIGVTNIFNTITTNMNLRQKEFAMLISIGMTNNEFDKGLY